MQENKVTDIAPEDLDRLGLLIEQGQFELLLPKVWENADVRREVPSDVREKSTRGYSSPSVTLMNG